MWSQAWHPCYGAFAGGAGGGGGGSPTTQRALLVVQLSQVDAYTSVCGEGAAQTLASCLIQAIGAQRGPIVVTDPQWALGSFSAARRRILAAVAAHPQVMWVRQDLVTERWNDARVRLVAALQRRWIHAVRVGGFWASERLH